MFSTSNDSNLACYEEAKKIFNGHNVSILGLTIGENRSSGDFKDQIRSILKSLVKDTNNYQQCTCRFMTVGLNDSSCIDLFDYSKVDPREENGFVLTDLANFRQIDGILAKDVSLPFIVLLNIQHEIDGKRINGNLILVIF
jgi:hypothetical protein